MRTTLSYASTSRDSATQRNLTMLNSRELVFISHSMENLLSVGQRHNDQAQRRASRVVGWPSAGALRYAADR